jgi:organic radical activating enzyme
MIKILFAPTSRCDRGCKHCMFSSTMAGSDIRPILARELLLELAALRGEKKIVVTGGGEPLLWPWLFEFIWQALGDERNKVVLVTSEERLRFSLPYLLRVNSEVNIKLTVDFDRHEAIHGLMSILAEERFQLWAVQAEQNYVHNSFLRDATLVEEETDLADHFLIRSCTAEEEYRYGREFDIVSIRPQTLALHGRGRALYQGIEAPRLMRRFTSVEASCCEFTDRERNHNMLHVNEAGEIYPCEGAQFGHQALRLGKLGEDRLSGLFAKKQKVIAEANRRYFTQPGFDPNPCVICAGKAKPQEWY